MRTCKKSAIVVNETAYKLIKYKLLEFNINEKILSQKINIDKSLVNRVIRGISENSKVRSAIEDILGTKIWNEKNNTLSSNNNNIYIDSREKEDLEKSKNQNTKKSYQKKEKAPETPPSFEAVNLITYFIEQHKLIYPQHDLPFNEPNEKTLNKWYKLADIMLKQIDIQTIRNVIDFKLSHNWWIGKVHDFEKFVNSFTNCKSQMDYYNQIKETKETKNEHQFDFDEIMKNTNVEDLPRPVNMY